LLMEPHSWPSTNRRSRSRVRSVAANPIAPGSAV
jgi:hypothetical protein